MHAAASRARGMRMLALAFCADVQHGARLERAGRSPSAALVRAAVLLL